MVSLVKHIFRVPLGDCWQIYSRLQELRIDCTCLSDGYLLVKVHNFSEALLFHSTIMQILAPRCELVEWLEFCWSLNDRGGETQHLPKY